MSFEERETYVLNASQNAHQSAKRFLSMLFAKCKTKQSDGTDLRPIFDNFIGDLLVAVNKPEWPVAETLLNLLGIVLVSQLQSEQADVSSRVSSLDYLGQIVAQLRKDSLEYQRAPQRVADVLAKLGITNAAADDAHSVFLLQRSLVAYLDALSATDAAMLYAKRYLVGQWLVELNSQTSSSSSNPAATSTTSDANQQEHGQQRVEHHAQLEKARKRLYSLLNQTAAPSRVSREI